MTAIGIYFKSRDQDEVNALRARLNAHAASHGYVATRGPTVGQGNLAEMLVAIDSGELATVLLADEQYAPAIAHLEQIDTEWARSIVISLRRSLSYQNEVDQAELDEYI